MRTVQLGPRWRPERPRRASRRCRYPQSMSNETEYPVLGKLWATRRYWLLGLCGGSLSDPSSVPRHQCPSTRNPRIDVPQRQRHSVPPSAPRGHVPLDYCPHEVGHYDRDPSRCIRGCGADDQDSAQTLQGRGGTSFHGPVSVGRCGGVRLGEKIPSLLGVTLGTAFGEHPSPQEVRSGRRRTSHPPVAQRRGLGEVGVGLVVAAEDGGKSTEVVADRA